MKESIIILSVWIAGALVFFKIIITFIGLFVVLYRLREQVVESGGFKKYFSKLISRWRE
jgi:hypothetical protein